jgi:hypothetical protein
MNKRTKLALRIGLVAVGVGLALSLACGDDGEDADSGASVQPTAAATAAALTPQTYQVKAQDYAFVDLPRTVAAGSKLELTNTSNKELHEMVVIHLPDSEKRPVSELIKLSDEELGEIATTEPAMVYLAPPSEKGFAAVGDGTVTEKGRYAVLCFIPTGADPAAFLAAANEGGNEPPEVEGGPPHAFNGMFGEIVVQ